MRTNTHKIYHNLWMDIAVRISNESHCVRRRVGAIAVKEDRIISIGWNGTFAGHDNCCEEKVFYDYSIDGPTTPEYLHQHWPHEELVVGDQPSRWYRLRTKAEVIHAEANMLGKLAGSAESARGASIYITDAPCIDCAKQLAVAGVKEVVYGTDYRNTAGIDYLKTCNVPVIKL